MPESLIPANALEHPFAPVIRILGKGKTGSRSLSFAEAEYAMAMILKGEVKEAQLGAFLMLLRVKEESPEELAGFATAVKRFINSPTHFNVQLDWPSYAGKRRQQNWYILVVILLAQNNIGVFMHGSAGHTAGRCYTIDIMQALELPIAENWQQCEQQLKNYKFSFMPLTTMCPPLQQLMDYRNDFGLRSPVHTLSRLINPLAAPYSLQSIFHPAYADSHLHANKLLKQPAAAVFKGEAGEIERKPEARCIVKQLRQNKTYVDNWPMLLQGRQEHEKPDVNLLRTVWRGEQQHRYGEQAVIGTLAIVLLLMEKAKDQQQAISIATEWWQKRDKNRLK